MKHAIAVKIDDEKDRARIRQLAASLGARLARRVKRLHPAAVRLHAVVEQHPERSLARAALSLRLPSRTLAVREEAADPESAVREAFRELQRVLEKEKARLRGEHVWPRGARRSRDQWLRRLREELGSVAASELALRLDAVVDHLDAVRSHVRREVALLEASGELAPGELEPDDVIDAVVVSVVARGASHASPAMRTRLLQIAAQTLRAELRQLQRERETVLPVEAEISETPEPEQVRTLGAEIFDFYQPDADLRLEDVLPAFGMATPEEEATRAELAAAVTSALAALPRRWRECLVLSDVEELGEDAVVAATGLPASEVRRMRERARELLRDRLAEAGWLGD